MSMLLTCAIAGIIPLLIGFVWYHPKVFGNAWMKLAGVDPNGKMNMPLVFGLTYLFGFFMAFAMLSVTIHQFGVIGLLQPEKGYMDAEGAVSALGAAAQMFEHKFRTFRHGVIHGTILSMFYGLPLIAINAMFERKNWKYILINLGYWVLTTALVGGVVCQFAQVSIKQ